MLGDGFAAGADQTLYNDKVRELLIDGVFGHDYFYEDAQAFNVYRVNLLSSQPCERADLRRAQDADRRE